MKKRTRYISASQIDRWLECPKAFKFVYIDGAKRAPPNEYMVYGSAIHEALAFNFRQKIKSKKDLPAEEVIDFFKTYYVTEVTGCNRMGYETDSNLLLKGEAVLHAVMEDLAPTIQPKLVEHKFELALKSMPIVILGIIDIVDQHDLIIDWKNIGKQTNADWKRKEDVALNSHQLTMYSAGFRVEFNRVESGVALDYLVRSHTPEYRRIQTTRTDQQVISLLQLAARIEESIKKDFYFANTKSCATCDFRGTCNRLSY